MILTVMICMHFVVVCVDVSYMGKSAIFPTDNKCLLIPAKFEGEATSPDFYFMLDGLILEKC